MIVLTRRRSAISHLHLRMQPILPRNMSETQRHLPGFDEMFAGRDRESFYFRGGYTCQLCGKLCLSTHEHLYEGLQGANHRLREDVMYTLFCEGQRGMSQLRKRIKCMPQVLLDDKSVFRIVGLLPPEGAGMEHRCLAVNRALRYLNTCGVLRHSLAPSVTTNGDLDQKSLPTALDVGDAASEDPFTQDEMEDLPVIDRRKLFDKLRRKTHNTPNFERLEYVGDNLWSDQTMKRIFRLFPQLSWIRQEDMVFVSTLRDSMESNQALEHVYEVLDIDSLLLPAVRSRVTAGKIRADVVEAIMGELGGFVSNTFVKFTSTGHAIDVPVDSRSQSELAAVAEHCINEICDVVALSFIFRITQRCLPLLKELVHASFFSRVALNVGEHARKDPSTALSRYSWKRVTLPQPLALHPVPTSSHDVCERIKQTVPPLVRLDCPASGSPSSHVTDAVVWPRAAVPRWGSKLSLRSSPTRRHPQHLFPSHDDVLHIKSLPFLRQQ